MHHTCTFCSKEFKRPFQLARHERSHTREKPFLCQFCGKGFAESGNVTKHVQVHHRHINLKPGERSYYKLKKEAKMSRKMSGDIELSRKHRSKSTTPTVSGLDAAAHSFYICDCGLRFKHKTRVKQHQMYCQIYTNRLKAKQTLTKEKNMGKDSTKSKVKSSYEYEFRCDKCSCTFRSMVSLQDHKRVHTKKRGHTAKSPIKLNDKNNSFGRPIKKIKHSLDSRVIKNSASVRLNKKVTASTTNNNSTASIDTASATDIGPVRTKDGTCSECGKYLMQKNWGQHRRKHTLNVLNTNCLNETTSLSSNTLYLCRYQTCNRAFVTLKAMSSHEMVHIESKPYVCDLCDERFRTRLIHDEHVKVCIGRLKDFPCLYCGKFYGKKSDLVRHKDVHVKKTGISYNCGHCSKRFPNRSELNKHHSDLHSKFEPKPKNVVFQCKFCSIKFTSKADLLEHAQTNHWSKISCTNTVSGLRDEVTPKRTTNEWLRCQFCNAKFRQMSNLTEHEKVHSLICNKCGLLFAFENSLKRHSETCNPAAATTKSNAKTYKKEDVSEEADQEEDVISISSSPSPSPSPSPPASPGMQSVQIQRLRPVPMRRPGGIEILHQFTATMNNNFPTVAPTATTSLPEPRDQIYLIQYSTEHINQGPLTLSLPDINTSRSAIRILPTGESPSVPIPVKLERVL